MSTPTNAQIAELTPKAEITDVMVERALSKYLALEIARLSPSECMRAALTAALNDKDE